MFGHIYTARLKCIVRDRYTMFWTLLFPVILATLFHLAFSNLGKVSTYRATNIAVVDDAAYRQNTSFQEALSEVSGGAKGALFRVTLCGEQKAQNLLQSGKIIGYVRLDGNPRMFVAQSGMDETILKEFLDDYVQTSAAVTQIAKRNPAALQNAAALLQNREYLKDTPPAGGNPDSTLNYFYALLGMACLYGGFLGLKEVANVQANQEPRAARVNLAPLHKLRVFAPAFCAAVTVQFLVAAVLIAFLTFVLGVGFGGRLPLILLACFASCCTGVSFGSMLGALIKAGEGMRIAVLISGTMFLSFLSGLFFGNVKYLVETHAPILGWLNPANVITDTFYSLYYYTTTTRYFTDIALLCGFTLVFGGITVFVLRRQRYESI